jgi:hypothetical protein
LRLGGHALQDRHEQLSLRAGAGQVLVILAGLRGRPPPRERIVAFVAVDGGGTYAEIRRGGRLVGTGLSGYLAALDR